LPNELDRCHEAGTKPPRVQDDNPVTPASRHATSLRAVSVIGLRSGHAFVAQAFVAHAFVAHAFVAQAFVAQAFVALWAAR